jgi:hypothetical protein
VVTASAGHRWSGTPAAANSAASSRRHDAKTLAASALGPVPGGALDTTAATAHPPPLSTSSRRNRPAKATTTSSGPSSGRAPQGADQAAADPAHRLADELVLAAREVVVDRAARRAGVRDDVAEGRLGQPGA